LRHRLVHVRPETLGILSAARRSHRNIAVITSPEFSIFRRPRRLEKKAARDQYPRDAMALCFLSIAAFIRITDSFSAADSLRGTTLRETGLLAIMLDAEPIVRSVLACCFFTVHDRFRFSPTAVHEKNVAALSNARAAQAPARSAFSTGWPRSNVA